MAIHELKQTLYVDAGDANIRHNTRDHRQDMTHYHTPLMRMHQTALHGWGIAMGLEVTAAPRATALTIAAGVAIDGAGRLLPLATEGHLAGQPGQAFIHDTAPAHLVPVPVILPTAEQADGTYYVTLELASTAGPEGRPVEGRWLPQEGRLVSTPLLKLQAPANFVFNGEAIILAMVILEGGAVSSLSGAERQRVQLAAGEVVVRRSVHSDPAAPLGDTESGRLGPLPEGGLQVTVPQESDTIELHQTGRRNFEELTVRANRLHVRGDLVITGTLQGALAPGVVGPAQLADDAVTSAKLQDASVTTPTLADSAVSEAKLAPNAVASRTLQDQAVSAAKLQDASVGTPKLADQAVSEAKLAANAVSSRTLQDASVGPTKLADNAVSAAKLQDASVGAAELADQAVSEAKLAANAVSGRTLQDASVGTAKLADQAVTSAKLQDASVGAAELANQAVSEAKLANGAVTSAKLANGAVTTDKLANEAVTTDKLANSTVTSAKLAGGAVTTAALPDGAITTPKLADRAATTAKIADSAISNAKLQNGSVDRPKLALSVAAQQDNFGLLEPNRQYQREVQTPSNGALFFPTISNVRPGGGEVEATIVYRRIGNNLTTSAYVRIVNLGTVAVTVDWTVYVLR